MTDTAVPDQLVIERVPITRLKLNETNPRRISKQRFDDLKHSLKSDPQMLEARPLIASLDGVVFAGNMRLRAAIDLGWETIPVAFVDLDDERKAYWTLRDNAGYGEWDEEMLAEQMYQLNELGYDMALTGFSKEDVDEILASTGHGGEGDPPAEKGSALDAGVVVIDDPQHEVKSGDVWDVGKHVLVCTSVHSGHKIWAPLLDVDSAMFLPYPGPAVTLTKRADDHVLILVQPDKWIAGHLLDSHEAINPGTVVKR